MTPGIRPLVAGNWKMNGTGASLAELSAISQGLDADLARRIEAVICVPSTLVFRASELVANSALKIGGEDCHERECGAHTGDISAEMLADAGASAIIVGHSERRADHGETDQIVMKKTQAVWRAGLAAILCIGETQAEREAGDTLKVLSTQLAGSIPSGSTPENLVIAYEPVWAIGTGLTPTATDVAVAHTHVRAELEKLVGPSASEMRILYGGSVKPSNAEELMAVENVDGALVGGASLKATDFLGIARVVYSKLT